MTLFKWTLIFGLVIGLVNFNPGESRAACGDGLLQNAQLYGADGAGGNSSNLYVLDPANGSILQTIGAIGFPVTGLAVHPSTGELFGMTTGTPNTNPERGFLLRVDEGTGQGTQIGDINPGNTETSADLAFAPDGTLFGWIEPNTDDLATIDLNTGLGTVVGDAGLSTAGAGLATLDGTTFLLAGAGTAGNLSSIDPTSGAETGTVTLNGYAGLGDEVSALDFDVAGVLFGTIVDTDVANRTAELITIDPSSGLITVLGPSVDRLDAIAFALVEACDDGNTSAGDGCAVDCQTVETGFTCPTPGQPCQPDAQCGNGVVEAAEVCDDGNTASGDGCTADCQTVEAGFVCPPTGGPCVSTVTPDLGGGGCAFHSSLGGGPLSSLTYFLVPLAVFLLRRQRNVSA